MVVWSCLGRCGVSPGIGPPARGEALQRLADAPLEGQGETERLVTMQRTHAARLLGDAERWRELLDADFPPGQPAHIADMVAFLASDRSAFTTGTIVTIDGGLCAR